MNILCEMLAECRRRNAQSIRFLDALDLEFMTPAQRQEVTALRSEIAITTAMIDKVEAELLTAGAGGRRDEFATVLRNSLSPGGNVVRLTDRGQPSEKGS